jgi:5-methylthioribose kinase
VIILSEDNLAAYIKEQLADKIDFITDAEVQNVAMAGGGLVSAVFKAQVGGDNLYFKQAIPGRLDKVKELVGGDVPEDAFIVWNDGRQYAEVKALQIVAGAAPAGFVPKVHYHDKDNNIIVLSEVCGQNGVVLANVMNAEINLKHAQILGANIARVANQTYGKFEALRDEELEKKIKAVKYRYEVAEVWANINDSDKRDRVIKKVSDFVATSSKMDRVLVHGDYHERNILICGDRCGTYDLEESHWGDPIEDIGKLTASYILRIIYFNQIKQTAYEAAIKLLDSYYDTLIIPEPKHALEPRMRIMTAGCMMMRGDGISSMWLPWVHDDAKKELARQLAVSLVLEDKQISIQTILGNESLFGSPPQADPG